MPTAVSIRLSGLAAMLCGALTIAFWFLHPQAADPSAARDAGYWTALVSPRFMAVNGMFLVIIHLSLLALAGFYARQSRRLGRLGFWGFVLALLGTAQFLAAGVVQAFVTPVLGGEPSTRALLDPKGPLLGGPLGGVLAAGGIAFGVGYVLFGIATVRARVLPRPAAWLLVLSSPILGLSPLMPFVARLVGSIAWGAGNLWLGRANWARPEPVE